MEKILVINCGSSSLKYEIYLMPDKESLGRGIVERIGSPGGVIKQKSAKGDLEREESFPDHQKAISGMFSALTDTEKGIIGAPEEIGGVGHRVVHGGEEYSSSVLIDDDVLRAVEKNIELAPLHNPANLTGIKEVAGLLPEVKQAAVFDTSFHQTIPPEAYLYGIPREFYEKYRIRRYGFHGTSHRYASAKAATMLGRSVDSINSISCHLGNGASITAISSGKSVDTSMGFTPLEGLVMGTRSGDLDPAILFYLMERGYSSGDLNDILNKKGGLLGLSGISNDLRDIEKAASEGDVNAAEALDVYAYRTRKYIGAYAANLGKVDVLIFTGGIGQFGVKMRERICSRLENIGIGLDNTRNSTAAADACLISADHSPVAVCMVPANEELQIAEDTYGIIYGF